MVMVLTSFLLFKKVFAVFNIPTQKTKAFLNFTSVLCAFEL